MKINLQSKNKAFTLIEYMVAITIGLILIAGFATFFVGMKQSTVSQDAITEVQENGRFAMYFLANDLQKAGYTNIEDKAFYLTPFDHIVFDGTASQTADGGGADANDVIKISYEGTQDCVGGNFAAGTMITNSFYVDDNDNLVCQGMSATEPLISNVESFHLQYGVDTDNNGSPNKFIKANQVSANSEASKVVSVKVLLLVRSETNIHRAPKSQSFDIFDEGATTAVSDRKLRKIFTTTVMIPNKVNIYPTIGS